MRHLRLPALMSGIVGIDYVFFPRAPLALAPPLNHQALVALPEYGLYIGYALDEFRWKEMLRDSLVQCCWLLLREHL